LTRAQAKLISSLYHGPIKEPRIFALEAKHLSNGEHLNGELDILRYLPLMDRLVLPYEKRKITTEILVDYLIQLFAESVRTQTEH